MCIIEILITKEEQALKSIGNSFLLLGKFTIEYEELVLVDAIENGANEETFEKTLYAGEKDFDPFKVLAASEADEEEVKDAKTVSNETLYSDVNYLSQALIEKPGTVSGADIKVEEDMMRRLRTLVPEEALPSGDTLRLSDDKAFCMISAGKSVPDYTGRDCIKNQ